MEYSPFNPMIWGLFLGFATATWLVVRVFFKKYPDYPGKTPDKTD